MFNVPQFFPKEENLYQPLTEKLYRKKILGDEITALINTADNVNLIREGEDEKTLLHFVAQQGMLEEINLLLAKGADIESQDKAGRTPLYDAIRGNQLDAVELLIARGANKDATDEVSRTPLQEAVVTHVKDSSRLAIIQCLLDSGVELKTQNARGDTILHIALTYNCDSAVIRALEKAGADMDMENNAGKTPQDIARALGRMEQTQPSDQGIKSSSFI